MRVAACAGPAASSVGQRRSRSRPLRARPPARRPAARRRSGSRRPATATRCDRRRCRPARPTTSPPTASSVACHAIAPRVWRRVNPIDRSTARSWRRRRTVVTSACATVAHASRAKNAAEREREVLDAGRGRRPRPAATRGLREERRRRRSWPPAARPRRRRYRAPTSGGGSPRRCCSDGPTGTGEARRRSSSRSGRSRCATWRGGAPHPPP